MPNGNGIDTLDATENLLEISRFDGGLNIKTANDLIGDTQATVRVNCHTDETGAIVKRGGRDYHYSTQITENKGIYGLYKFYKRDGTGYFIAACDTKLHQDNGTDWSTEIKIGLTANKSFKFATYDISDIALIVNGADAPMKYDGATVTALGGSPPSTMVDVIVHNNRAFGYIPNSSYLYCSALGNMESWDTTNWKWLVGSTTGSHLTGMGVLQGMLALFKHDSVRLFMTDGDRTGWQMGDPLTNKGCVARHTVCNAMLKGVPVLLYLGGDGVYAFDGRGSISLTENNLDPIWTSSTYIYRINKSYAHTSCAVVHNGKYYLSYPSGSATLPNWMMVYDIINGGWSFYDYGVNCFCKLSDAFDKGELYSGQTVLGYIQREEYGDDDFDADITMQYKTKYFAPFGKNVVNQFWRQYVRAESNASIILRTIMDIDFGIKQLTKDHYLVVSGATWNNVNWDEFDWVGGMEMFTYDETLQQELNGRQIAIEFYNKSKVGLKVHYGGILSTAEYMKQG